MWPYGQTPPLEKCKQPDLKQPKAMLQSDICPQNSPRGVGGFVSWPMDYPSQKVNGKGIQEKLCFLEFVALHVH